jgi:ABC-type multidrug transport system ATPase subunit
MSDVAAEVRDLRMRYGATDVLHGTDFDIRTGEVVALLAPNGAGKTTTIEILEGVPRAVREALEGLEVRRASLEDTYMALVEEYEK